MGPEISNTVDNPDYVTIDASRDRLELANDARALEMALDAADSIEARDSLEKMFVHQMAALRRSAMKLSARTTDFLNWLQEVRAEDRQRSYSVEACRLAGAFARVSCAYQQGYLTLRRIRAGGRQHVTVQNIHQQGAVVTSKLGDDAQGAPGDEDHGSAQPGDIVENGK